MAASLILQLGITPSSKRIALIATNRLHSTLANAHPHGHAHGHAHGQGTGQGTGPGVDADTGLDPEWSSARPFSDIPGPRPLPLIGNAWRFVFGDLARGDPANLIGKLLQDYGPIVKLGALPGLRDVVLVFDAEAVQKVVRNEGTWPERHGFESWGSIQRQWPERYEGAWGLVSTNGKNWASFRSAVNQTLMQPRNVQLHEGDIDKINQEFIDRMRAVRDTKNKMPADFMNELYKWSHEATVYVALGKRLGCLRGDVRADAEAQRLIDNVRALLHGVYEMDMRPSLWKILPTPAYLRMKRTMASVYDTLSGYAEETMERLEQHRDRACGRSVLESLLQRNDNPRIAVTMAMDMVTAGADTVANTTAIIMYHLANNPEKQRKLQGELDRVFLDPAEPITATKLEEVKYLRACIKEAQRLTPVGPGNQRQTVKDTVVSGYQIPKGVEVLFAFSEMAKMERYFPRALDFIPERWLVEGEHLKATHPFAFMPFGFGPRSCVGRRFAQLEMETLIAKVFRNFHVLWNRPSLRTKSSFQFVVVSPLKFECVDRM